VSWIADAYNATGVAWERGPGPIYNRLAEVVVGCSPVALAGRRVLDLGAGTGAASRALARAGARPVASDFAVGMLAVDRDSRPSAVAADATALPFRDRAFDAVVAAFSFNHLAEPAGGFREAVRVTRPGGAIVASVYAADDTHPVKAAVEQALREAGWEPEAGYEELRTVIVPLLATPERFSAATAAAGLPDASVRAIGVDFDDLGPNDLVEWRLGMAHHAPFTAALSAPERTEVRRRALELLGPRTPALRRSILVAVATVPGGRLRAQH
jgi:SAM-dependent methyltransferase